MMKYNRFEKGKYGTFTIEGECHYCKTKGEWVVKIYTQIDNRTPILERPEEQGAIFLWNNAGPTKKDIIDYLNGKELIKIKYMSKLYAGMRNKDTVRRFGFPRLILTCPECFRKKGETK